MLQLVMKLSQRKKSSRLSNEKRCEISDENHRSSSDYRSFSGCNLAEILIRKLADFPDYFYPNVYDCLRPCWRNLYSIF